MVYSDEIEDKIDQIMLELKHCYPNLINYRWHALKLLEGDKEITEKYPMTLPKVLDRSYESDIINQKYDFIGEVISEVDLLAAGGCEGYGKLLVFTGGCKRGLCLAW